MDANTMAGPHEFPNMTKILDNVEHELSASPPAPVATPSRASIIESFAPQRHRNVPTTPLDNMEQIQQDFRKALQDLETRFKTLIDDFKRAAG